MTPIRELFIVRHAKSSWDYDNISDIDRPLKLKGIRNAYEMARRMKIDRNLPQSFISSPANRALHTAIIFLSVFELPFSNLVIDKRLYGYGKNEIMEVIKSQNNDILKLMIFGHNPDFSEIARTFAGNQSIELTTCGIAVFEFKCKSWSEISASNVTFEFHDFPGRI
jgi:phosphohistidine phosphatase